MILISSKILIASFCFELKKKRVVILHSCGAHIMYHYTSVTIFTRENKVVHMQCFDGILGVGIYWFPPDLKGARTPRPLLPKNINHALVNENIGISFDVRSWFRLTQSDEIVILRLSLALLGEYMIAKSSFCFLCYSYLQIKINPCGVRDTNNRSM